MTESVHIGCLQTRLDGSTEDNLERIETGMQEAARQDIQLLVLPELHQGPYFCQNEDASVFDRAEPIPGPTTEHLGRLAQRHGLVLVASLFERRMEGIFHNTAVVFDRDGQIAGLYRKMHIPDDPGYYEKFYFSPGDQDGFQPIDTSVGRLGVLICWDQWFPEAARLMALAGAEILVYPTAIGWDIKDAASEQARQLEAWQTVQRGHAVANHLPLICCNRTGWEAHPREQGNGSQFWGHSFICDAQGAWLARTDEQTEGLLSAQWDRTLTRDLRRIWPFFRDRRIDAYQGLTTRSQK
ncbi:MAG: acyltransferase [Gammaproteobacteria bacterium]|nr:MAG: acyltransferase [Gammaproteobacteria bacterium]